MYGVDIWNMLKNKVDVNIEEVIVVIVWEDEDDIINNVDGYINDIQQTNNIKFKVQPNVI